MRSEKAKQRQRYIARLGATGLYTSEQIGEVFGIKGRTVDRVCKEQGLPDNPFLSFEEAALIEGVNDVVIQELVKSRHLACSLNRTGLGVDVYGKTITRAVSMHNVLGISSKWISVEDAALAAGMETPRGMYNRAIKGQVVSIKAPRGKAFHIGGKKGLKILIRKGSIEPAQERQRPVEPLLLGRTSIEAQPELIVTIWADTSGKVEPTIVSGKSIRIKLSANDASRKTFPLKRLLEIKAGIESNGRPKAVVEVE